ncbi:putative quinol monooxygenase [Leucobacter ruminantium]|uniref:Antibiotic biosynthesis monooxygenase n=1 Tax=Leucobacter ruminantium TaxID=1289170 RepID=A0A939LXU5_9MICO|nr:putative quinol monooxygenase [Leucobacter ruminantium]MBO1806086.1 antibiotic biosynthesis monooxygenase [Leucobacter ruminantium]
MYFIVVKYQVRPEFAAVFLERTAEFTAATRAEPGNLWFDWSRSVDDPNEFVLVEAFADDEAASAHVNSEHFPKGLEAMRPLLVSTPKIVSRKVEGSGWDEMGELRIASADAG